MTTTQALHPTPTRETMRALLTGVRDAVEADLPQILALRNEVTWKEDGSPVTAADYRIEGYVRSYLEAHLPDLVFIGEESFDTGTWQMPTGFSAVLDPIDGTENFCSGLKEWGVSLTIWQGNTHLGSLLYMPELREHLMTGDRLAPVTSRIRGFSSSMCDEILQAIAETRESRLMGCAVYNLYNVVRGAFARFSNPRGAYSWDLLPGLMLALEHNCDIEVEGKTYHGEFLAPGRKYRVDIRHRYDLHPG